MRGGQGDEILGKLSRGHGEMWLCLGLGLYDCQKSAWSVLRKYQTCQLMQYDLYILLRETLISCADNHSFAGEVGLCASKIVLHP